MIRLPHEILTDLYHLDPDVIAMRVKELESVVTIDENDKDMAEPKRLVDIYELLTGVRLS